MRSLLIIAGAVGLSLAQPRIASAHCGTTPSRRHLVAQPRDVFFTAGVAETKYIDDVFVNNDSTGEPTGAGVDCGAVASSTLSSVSVQENYCSWDQPAGCPWHLSGDFAPVDKTVPEGADDPSNPIRGKYRYYELNHIRQIAIRYDGSQPAGTQGKIDIYLQGDEGLPPQYITGSVNIYIVSGTAPSTWFTSTSGASNISGDSFFIDHPLLNGNPSAKVFSTHAYYGSYHNHPTSVTYDGTAAKWKIRNEDGAAMVPGISFFIRTDPSAFWVLTPSVGSSSTLMINNPESNGNPYATILVSVNTRGSRRVAHPIGVKYISPNWYITTLDGSALPASNRVSGDITGFYVKVIGASQYYDDYVIGDAAGFKNTTISNGAGVDLYGPYRINGPAKYLSGFCFTTQGLLPVIVTPTVNPLPPPAPRNYNYQASKYLGVYASGPTMYVYHEDASAMSYQEAFNVWGAPPTTCDPAYNVNVAAAVNGGVATSSGEVAGQPAWTANDGRRSTPYDQRIFGYAYWKSSTDATVYNCNYGNWWVRVDFASAQDISEVDLFSLQDDYLTAGDPMQSTLTTLYGNVDFHLSYCPENVQCGATLGSGWVDVPGGYITGNNKAWNSVFFTAVRATAVRASLDCAQRTRAYVVELEAWKRN